MVAQGNASCKVFLARVTGVVELRVARGGFHDGIISSFQERVAAFARLSFSKTLVRTMRFPDVVEHVQSEFVREW